jgi:hypothetical protein
MRSQAAQRRLMRIVQEYSGGNFTEGEMIRIAEQIWTDHGEGWTKITEDELIAYMDGS